MKRRTYRKLRAGQQPAHHHHVYVVLLDSAAGRIRNVRAENPRRDPSKPCVYVGMTGLTPEERFANHKAGIKAAWVVNRHGIGLVPELYVHLNLMPFEAAVETEKDLADDLRRAGYTVAGGTKMAAPLLMRAAGVLKVGTPIRAVAPKRMINVNRLVVDNILPCGCGAGVGHDPRLEAPACAAVAGGSGD